MKVDVEAVWCYAASVILSAYMYLNFPNMRGQVVFYFMVTTGSAVIISTLGSMSRFVNPVKVAEAAMYTILNMWIWALIFQILNAKFAGLVMLPLPSQTRQTLLNVGVPLAYFLLVGIGETLFYIGIPLALARSLRQYGYFRYVPAIAIHVMMGILFTTLHIASYPSLFLLLQPFIAGTINTYIAIWKKNLTGVMLGHFIIDYLIVAVGII